MRYIWGDVATVALGACLGLVLGVVVASEVTSSHWEQQAIERGYAQYHPVTGEWGWIEKPEQEEKE